MSCSGCGIEAQRIEEMEKMLKEAQQEKARLIENRVSDGTSFLVRGLIVVCMKRD